MSGSNFNILVLLVAFTLVTVMVTRFLDAGAWGSILIMGIALAKYLLVAFYFMELRKAHRLWKFVAVLIGFLVTAVVALTIAAG